MRIRNVRFRASGRGGIQVLRECLRSDKVEKEI